MPVADYRTYVLDLIYRIEQIVLHPTQFVSVVLDVKICHPNLRTVHAYWANSLLHVQLWQNGHNSANAQTLLSELNILRNYVEFRAYKGSNTDWDSDIDEGDIDQPTLQALVGYTRVGTTVHLRQNMAFIALDANGLTLFPLSYPDTSKLVHDHEVPLKQSAGWFEW